jgi:hypothetical protein
LAWIYQKKRIELARQAEEREPLGIQYEVASFTDLSIFKSASKFLLMKDQRNEKEKNRNHRC